MWETQYSLSRPFNLSQGRPLSEKRPLRENTVVMFDILNKSYVKYNP